MTGSASFLHAQCRVRVYIYVMVFIYVCAIKIHFVKLATQPNELIGYFENMVAMETPLYMCWDVFELLRQLLHADTTLDINTLLTPEILK